MSSKGVQRMTEFSKQVFEAAEVAFAAMQDGERVQIKQLAETVAVNLTKPFKKVLGFVDHFAHDTELGYVTRGKNGGLVKGPKPVKVIKAGKKSKQTADSVDSTKE